MSRPKATRDMRILGSEGEIIYSADSNSVKYINTSMDDWLSFDLGAGKVEDQYINPEEPYIAEMRDFISAVVEKDQALFPNSLRDDYKILQTLEALEKMTGA